MLFALLNSLYFSFGVRNGLFSIDKSPSGIGEVAYSGFFIESRCRTSVEVLDFELGHSFFEFRHSFFEFRNSFFFRLNSLMLRGQNSSILEAYLDFLSIVSI